MFFFVKYKTSVLSNDRFAKEAQAFKETSFSKATMVMRFTAKKKASCPEASRDFPPRKDGILYPPSVCLGTPLLLPQSLCGRTDVQMYGRADGRSRDYYVTTKISRIDRLPNFLSNGAPLAGFARRLRYEEVGNLSSIR